MDTVFWARGLSGTAPTGDGWSGPRGWWLSYVGQREILIALSGVTGQKKTLVDCDGVGQRHCHALALVGSRYVPWRVFLRTVWHLSGSLLLLFGVQIRFCLKRDENLSRER